MKKRFIFALAALILANVPAFAAEQKLCPVLPKEKVTPRIYTDYKGQRIFFCCNKCKRMFAKNPQSYLKNLPS